MSRTLIPQRSTTSSLKNKKKDCTCKKNRTQLVETLGERKPIIIDLSPIPQQAGPTRMFEYYCEIFVKIDWHIVTLSGSSFIRYSIWYFGIWKPLDRMTRTNLCTNNLFFTNDTIETHQFISCRRSIWRKNPRPSHYSFRFICSEILNIHRSQFQYM